MQLYALVNEGAVAAVALHQDVLEASRKLILFRPTSVAGKAHSFWGNERRSRTEHTQAHLHPLIVQGIVYKASAYRAEFVQSFYALLMAPSSLSHDRRQWANHLAVTTCKIRQCTMSAASLAR